MFFNSLSSSNTSLLHPPLPSSNSSLNPASASCFRYRFIFALFTAFSVTNILVLLPLCLFILYLGLKRWQKRHSASTAAVTSHSDVFAYHMVAIEMIGIMGCCFYCCGAWVNVPWMMTVGLSVIAVTSNGQVFFNILSCVDRHLAVVHPIIYLSLRQRGGVRIRNITTGCIWLLYLGSFGLNRIGNFSTIPGFCLSVFSVLVVSFCSLSVLCALIRPGPGEADRERKRVDQSKMRAFYTIMAIMGALLFRFGGHLLVLAVYASVALSERVRCGVLVSGVWFSLPSSLVLPLLFLHRAGKLVCMNSNTSEQGSE